VTAYIRFQREQLDRASLFSDVWQRAIWQDPDLDYTLQRPVSTLGKRQWQDARAPSANGHGAALGERYGLFYFFAQSCGACEVMSPIVKSSPRPGTSRCARFRPTAARRGISRTTRSRPTSAPAWASSPRITPAVVLWDSQPRAPDPDRLRRPVRRRAAGPHLPPHLEGSRT
jgi:conjugal transfer pilus assembly protein TraF